MPSLCLEVSGGGEGAAEIEPRALEVVGCLQEGSGRQEMGAKQQG